MMVRPPTGTAGVDGTAALTPAKAAAPALFRAAVAAMSGCAVEAPADAGGATGKPFVLKLAQRGITVPVAADQSAVDALHGVGIDIPVSCQQGLCGTCVVAGEGAGAEHRDFCLTRSERSHKIALCCARAVGEELVLDL